MQNKAPLDNAKAVHDLAETVYWFAHNPVANEEQKIANIAALLSRYIAAAKALVEHLENNGWQDMSTAPKDGTQQRRGTAFGEFPFDDILTLVRALAKLGTIKVVEEI